MGDIPGWTFDFHCRTISRLLSSKYAFYTSYGGQWFNPMDYDLVYPLEWNLLPFGYRLPNMITGIRSHLSWDQYDFNLVLERLRHFKIVHVVSQRLYDIFSPHLPVRYVTHGVDIKSFCPPRVQRMTKRIVVGWAGNRASKVKGYEEFIQPLSNLEGVTIKLCGYGDRKVKKEEMPGWYCSLDVYICSSSSEGNNNPLMEAAACGLPIITTDNGTVPEIFKDHESALIVDRHPQSFSDALRELRDDRSLRMKLGRNARLAIKDWDWSKKIRDYDLMFEEALNG